MKVMFVYDDGPDSSFFLYNLDGGINGLMRISPEVKIMSSTLGKLYQRLTMEEFLAGFSDAFSLDVRKYLTLSKADLLGGIEYAGLDRDGKVEVEVEKDFVAVLNGKGYKKGTQRLDIKDIEAYVHYQIDQDGSFDVFTRQEDIIRLMRKRSASSSLRAITKNYGTVKEHTASNLNLKDMLLMGKGYLSKGDKRMPRETVPEKGSYTLIGDFPYQLGEIDWSKNTAKLKAEYQER